jgi:hypothetical protein
VDAVSVALLGESMNHITGFEISPGALIQSCDAAPNQGAEGERPLVTPDVVVDLVAGREEPKPLKDSREVPAHVAEWNGIVLAPLCVHDIPALITPLGEAEHQHNRIAATPRTGVPLQLPAIAGVGAAPRRAGRKAGCTTQTAVLWQEKVFGNILGHARILTVSGLQLLMNDECRP